MIIDEIKNLQKYENRNSGFSQVRKFLENNKGKSIENGIHTIDGKNVFAIVENCKGKGRSKAYLEVHRKYIDIQLCLEGKDLIGFKPFDQCSNVKNAYHEKNDIQFFNDDIDNWIEIDTERFACFYPFDAHAPLATTENIKKIVFKISVNLEK